MTYRITLVLAGGYSLSCLADEAIRDGCVEAHDAAGAGLIEWPFPDTSRGNVSRHSATSAEPAPPSTPETRN